jgi:hypothetical protein
MKYKMLLLAVTSFITSSCGQPDSNKVENSKGEIYRSDTNGWSIEIPQGYSIILKDQMDVTQREREVLDDAGKISGKQIDTKKFKELIKLQKGFNLFMASSESFIGVPTDEYYKDKNEVNQLIFKTFAEKGVKIDTSRGEETIQGLEFNTFYVAIHDSDNKIIMHEIYYYKLLNGYDFDVLIGYTNEDDKKILLDAWKNSKFDATKN